MPIDLSHEVLTDPDFLSIFTVYRRTESVDENGELKITSAQYPRVYGIVAPPSDNELSRTDDYGKTSRTLSIVSKFRFIYSQSGYQPDLVQWDGNRYIVKSVEPYGNYGSGFYEIVCESMELLDA